MQDRELPADAMPILTIAAAIGYVIPYAGSALWGVTLPGIIGCTSRVHAWPAGDIDGQNRPGGGRSSNTSGTPREPPGAATTPAPSPVPDGSWPFPAWAVVHLLRLPQAATALFAVRLVAETLAAPGLLSRKERLTR